MVEDELEDEPETEPVDPFAGWRRLALAIVLRAVMDSKLRDRYVPEDATRFLYGRNDHFHRLAECAQLDRDWLRECLARTVDVPMPALRICRRCKSPIPHEGMAGRYCITCREVVPFYPKQSAAAQHRNQRA